MAPPLAIPVYSIIPPIDSRPDRASPKDIATVLYLFFIEKKH
jgi:hypothetical protein